MIFVIRGSLQHIQQISKRLFLTYLIACKHSSIKYVTSSYNCLKNLKTWENIGSQLETGEFLRWSEIHDNIKAPKLLCATEKGHAYMLHDTRYSFQLKYKRKWKSPSKKYMWVNVDMGTDVWLGKLKRNLVNSSFIPSCILISSFFPIFL